MEKTTLTTAQITGEADNIIAGEYRGRLPQGCGYSDIVRGWVLRDKDTKALIEYVDSLPTWVDGYSELAVQELSRRADLDYDAYEDMDELWDAICAALV